MEHGDVRCERVSETESDATYEFLARLLLSPMSGSLCDLVLKGEIWNELSSNGYERLVSACTAVDEALAPLRDKPVERARRQLATEYTRLFVGPENQLIPPWESLYEGDRHHLFGKPVFEVRSFMRSHGMASAKGNSWPEDHLGVELLVLQQIIGTGAIADNDVDEIGRFIEEHPLWLVRKMNETAHGLVYEGSGFYRALLELIEVCLEADARDLRTVTMN